MLLDIDIVPQKREFGCAKAVIKTLIKTKNGREIRIKDPLLYIKSLGTLNFLGLANDTFKELNLPYRMRKKTNVTTRELRDWVEKGKLMVVIFISKENYPHYAVIAGVDNESVLIANTHSAQIERFPLSEFIERWYLNPRYVNHIQWMHGQDNPFVDRIVQWGIKVSKLLFLLRPGTIYILDE